MRISPINLKILAYTLDVEGFDSSAALRACGFEALDDIKEDGPWVPAEMLDRMMAAALHTTGDPHFGLVAGRSLALMRYGVIAQVVMPSPGLRQMLEDIMRFGRLSLEQAEVELEEHSQGPARLVVRPVVKGGASGHFRMQLVATSAIQMLRFGGASSQDIHQVDFPFAAPVGHEARYTALFGARIQFDSRRCEVHFNPALLNTALPTHDPVSYKAARTRAEALLAAMESGNGVAEQVRRWLLSQLPVCPTVADTAAALGTTERTLRRQLEALGTSHAQIVQECQQLTAEQLLAEGQSIKQIADAVGFSSVHGFHRAFRRWTGQTPTDWRDTAP
jgi:AraC-like DNA-binding protein